MSNELYFSIDIEADGPCPGLNSMLSLGCVVFDDTGAQLGSYYATLQRLPEASIDRDTAEWWKTQPEAYKQATKGARPAIVVMNEFEKWVNKFWETGKSPVFVGYPAGFDFTYVYWYFMKFVGFSPFSFSAIDMKTLAMAKLGTSFRDTTKKAFPKEWKSSKRHTHNALDDAFEQGEIFCKMMGFTNPRPS